MITHCASNGLNGEITGTENLNTPYPIASVSKIFTSLWALEKLGAHYRFPTQVYLKQLAGGTYDVHLRGSVFPYFDRIMFYYLITELNKRGVTQINQLTYDENFEYGSFIRDNKILAHSAEPDSPSRVMHELRADVTLLKKNYQLFVKTVQTASQVVLPKSVSLTVKDISPLSMNTFDKNSATKSFIIKSIELHRILKEMNRNSNNFAADKIFDRLSRTGNFSYDLSQSLQLDSSEFNFINGSGYPEILKDQKIYNSATCTAVIKANKRLFEVVAEKNLGLESILPVAGIDAKADENSTVTTLYSSTSTDSSLIAKTGTIDPSVSLSGAVLTKNELIYFHVTSTTKDYLSIKNFIDSLIESNGGNLKMIYTPQAFLPFDEKSISDVQY